MTIAFTVALLLGPVLYMGYCGAMPLYRLNCVRSWKPGKATVLRSGYRELPQAETFVWYRPVVTYSYEVDGKSYESARLGITDNAFDESSERRFRGFMDSVAPGCTIAIRFSPEDPSRSVMAPGCTAFRRSHYLALVGSSILLIALLAIAFYFTT